MNDSARLRKVINSKFQLKSSIDLFPKTEHGQLCPMIVWNKKTKDEWYQKEEDWQNKLLAGQRFHCKVCGIFTSNFNFIPLKKIYNINRDTYSNKNLFFSHRRSTHKGKKSTGRLINLISLT